jgi:DNA-binding NtrC family response regulator
MLFDSGANAGAGADAASSYDALRHLPYAEAKRRILDAYHRAVFPKIVADSGGSVAKAADKLGMSRANLYRVLQELGTKIDDA